MNTPTIYAIVNIFFQLFAVFASQMLGLVWPLYVVMGMLGLVIFMQIIVFSAIHANISLPRGGRDRVDKGIAVLVGIAYGASCYQLYILGFTFFAAMASTNVAIIIFANLIRKE